MAKKMLIKIMLEKSVYDEFYKNCEKFGLKAFEVLENFMRSYNYNAWRGMSTAGAP